MPAGYDSHIGLVTPHRRQHSDGTSQAYARSLPGYAETYLAGLHQPKMTGRQAMDASLQELQQAAFSGQGLHHTAFSEQELQQSALAGQSLQQAALVQQGLNQSVLTGHAHSFTPHTPIPWMHLVRLQ